jgi:hypothetical protein
MEHLATGTVPTDRDQRLLDQARHWNLERLVQALEALTPGVTLTNDPDGKTCTAQCRFYPVMEKLHDKATLKFTFCGPKETWWSLEINCEGVLLRAVPEPGDDGMYRVEAKAELRVLLKDKVLKDDLPPFWYSDEKDCQGSTWGEWRYGYDQLASEPLARAHDCLVLEVDICVLD